MTETCENCGHNDLQHSKCGCGVIIDSDKEKYGTDWRYCPCKKFKPKKGLDKKSKGCNHEGTFNLSKKIVESDAEDYIDVPDVKEFIKLLKDAVCYCERGFSPCTNCKSVDKLAGDALR